VFVLRLGGAARLGERLRGFGDRLRGGDARGLGGLGLGDLTAAALAQLFFLGGEARGVVGDDTHVPLGALDLLAELSRDVLARDVFALLAPDGVVQEDEGVFEFDEAGAGAGGGLVGEDEVCFEPDHPGL
jgi:hypothetical protein